MAPPTQGIPTVIRIPVELLARLDQHAATQGITRAELVRRILTEALSETGDKWRDVAETLWEELQEWHDPECPTQQPGPDCACHRILARVMRAATDGEGASEQV